MTVDIFAIKGDITRIKTDVIVNAANTWMRGGGGVDGAIHRAAGTAQLLEELERRCPNSDCPVGEVVWTTAHDLPAKFIIHAVGPDFRREDQQDISLLENCYINAMDLADRMEATCISFPLISSGIFGCPKEDAARAAVWAIRNFDAIGSAAFPQARTCTEVNIICFDDADFELVERIIEEPMPAHWSPSLTVRSAWQSAQVATIVL